MPLLSVEDRLEQVLLLCFRSLVAAEAGIKPLSEDEDNLLLDFLGLAGMRGHAFKMSEDSKEVKRMRLLNLLLGKNKKTT